MDNVTVETLERKFKGEGVQRFTDIARIGGFGTIGTGQGFIPIDTPNGLDLKGVLDPENKALSDGDKNKLRDLAGITAEKSKGKSKGKSEGEGDPIHDEETSNDGETV